MTRSTDNRWSPGASGADVPDEAVAAYGARWIDYDTRPADVVPDRQGFAYTADTDRDTLMRELIIADPRLRVGELPYDETVELPAADDDATVRIFVRRAGGYVYVDAWLDPAEANS